MKPRNKFQEQVLAYSQDLSPITEKQYQWALEHCFDNHARKLKSGKMTCLECGHSWQGNRGTLADIISGCTCPNCGKELKIEFTQKRTFKENEYFGIITTCNGFQVFRYFFISATYQAGKPVEYSCHEVTQRWIAPNGKSIIVARLRQMNFMYYDLWNFDSKLEIRNHHRCHDIEPRYYPQKRFIPKVKQAGYNGNTHKLHICNFLRYLLSSNKAETLLKTGRSNLFRYFADNHRKIDKYWVSICICHRNGYAIDDVSLWIDYIDNLLYCGKDIHNPKYICPSDLRAEHHIYIRKKLAILDQERTEEKRRKAIEDDQQFKKSKSKFFGLEFTDGTIQVRTLESIDDFYEEGKAMRHCVFTNSYYLKENSLILSATIDGKRIETIEISLSTMEIVQSRGVCNQSSEYHNRIIDLVNQNITKIQQRLTA